MIEEPENHLSFSTLQKMLKEIGNKKKTSQIIVTTHNSLIASRLSLKNVLWITEKKVISLNNVNTDDAEFFIRADDNAFLKLLLSEKIFLVEGATEFLLLPMFYKDFTGRSIEQDKITVISCNGISYKRYLNIAGKANKKIAVITDNDKNEKKIEYANNFNDNHSLQHIFMSNKIEEWTWEICLYNENKRMLKDIVKVDSNANYLFHGIDYGPIIGKMLNNKVDMAYKMLTSGMRFEIPQYLKEAISWLEM